MAQLKVFALNKEDRNKIKALADSLGDEYHETRMQISIPAWGRRFWFGVAGGIEHIRGVDNISRNV